MKKSFRKLQLSRETLGPLDNHGLRSVHGGDLRTTGLNTSEGCDFPTACACDTVQNCGGNTWEHTCTILCCSTMAHC